MAALLVILIITFTLVEQMTPVVVVMALLVTKVMWAQRVTMAMVAITVQIGALVILFAVPFIRVLTKMPAFITKVVEVMKAMKAMPVTKIAQEMSLIRMITKIAQVMSVIRVIGVGRFCDAVGAIVISILTCGKTINGIIRSSHAFPIQLFQLLQHAMREGVQELLISILLVTQMLNMLHVSVQCVGCLTSYIFQ